MKITLKPTEYPSKQHSVTIETAYDGHNISEVVQLLADALIAWGYHPDNVKEYLSES